MKIKARLLSLLLAALLLLPMLPVGSVSAADDAQTSYTKNKVVSVLFDNSGSMTEVNRQKVYRWEYAKYALQTLMSTLGRNDKLIITPMNKIRSYDEVTSWNDPNVIEVNLSAEDRDAEIARVMTSAQSFLSVEPYGMTPETGIKVAVDQLVQRYGMKTTDKIAADEKSENEYFLVVLTDGAFNCCNANTEAGKIKQAADCFKDDLSKYAFFQSIYIGFDTDALDLSQAADLKDKANFASFKAPDTASIGDVMKNVANRITGRYPLELSVDPNSKTIRIPLDSVGFGLRTVTVLATNTNARFVSATYNGTPVGVSQKAAFDTTVDGMKGGFTSVLNRGGNVPFAGGEIVLSLDEAPGSDAVISVLLEPALALEPVIEVDDGVGRKEVNASYINSNMKKGDTVYLSYRILEQGTNNVVDSSLLGGASSARVTYNTKSYAIGDPITLVEGKKEIALSVTMLGGKYSLYTSFPCVVLENPTFFRIEQGDVAIVNSTTFKIPFTVYNQNTALSSLAALEAFSPSVTVEKEDGTAYSNYSLQKNSDGTFTVTLNTAGQEYGTFTVKASVKDSEGNPRSVDVPIGYYPSGLTLTNIGADSLSKTLHGVKGNTQGYSFELTAGTDDEKVKIPFTNALLSYRLTVGGVDVTAKAKVNGNVLSFVPTADTLGDLATKTGDYDVVLLATFRGATTETVESKSKLLLTDTIFEVVPLNPTGKLNRFNLRKNQSTISFKVLRDGAALSAEELQTALDDGTLYLDHSSYRSGIAILSPVRTQVTVETASDGGVLTVLPVAGHFFPLRPLLTSMLVLGTSIDFDVHYGSVNAVGVMGLTEAGIFAYVWRILVVLYIIQLFILVLTKFVLKEAVKRVPKGVLVSVPLAKLDRNLKNDFGDRKLKQNKGRDAIYTTVTCVKVVKEKDRFMPKRFVPFYGLFQRENEVDSSDGVLARFKDEAGVGIGVDADVVSGEINNDAQIIEEVRSRYSSGSLDDDEEFPIENRNVVVKYMKESNVGRLWKLTSSSGLVKDDVLLLFIEL